MREIKFRMWNFENQEMINGDSLAFEEYAPISQLLSQKGIMQYTGLKDRNGREIYEGDIVCCTDDTGIINLFDPDTGIGEVEWLYSLGFWNVTRIDNCLGDLIRNGYHLEIIGNIYEHPHLLNQE
ncbi:hypothetical protein J5TS2_40830 [Brevibacillus halotolerans]|uniref:YopX family protein n=1 Tax=Brevibacillus halotolerans TaxID=1507437 RepID=UPI001B2672D3|nr:YopX family protein [Brevibacillus halotolerans]GIO03415.1 hypothetical protein J5TS2_40830 [Brevibacillus halotolerans]